MDLLETICFGPYSSAILNETGAPIESLQDRKQSKEVIARPLSHYTCIFPF